MKEIKEKGEINVKSKNMMITNEIAEITIKRYTKLIKAKEKLNEVCKKLLVNMTIEDFKIFRLDK